MTTNPKVTASRIGGAYTLSRGPRLQPFQFEGEILAEVESYATDPKGHKDASGFVSHRAAIYRTRRGTIVTEVSSVDHTGQRAGIADVFGSLGEACEWFRPGSLTTQLMQKLSQRESEIIDKMRPAVYPMADT